MLKKLSVAGFVATLVLVWSLAAQSPAQKAIEDSLKAMGLTEVKTLTIWGEGGDGAVGQQRNQNGDYWRWYNNADFERGFDFDAKAFRTKRVRWEGATPPGGGNGTTTPAPIQNQNQITQINNFNAEVEAAMTPIGFLKMAMSHETKLTSKLEGGKQWKVLSWEMTGGQGKATYPTTLSGYIDAAGLVQKVEVLISHDFLGDISWNAQFTGWKDYGGVKFPSKIVQRQWTPKIFELSVSNVRVNDPVNLTPAAAAAGKGAPGGAGAAKGGAPAPGGAGAAKGGPGGPGAAKGPAAPAGPLSEDLGGGFWLVTGGYATIVADFKDYAMLVELGSNDERTEQVLAEAKRLVPNKPIRYVINTHFHFDHTGGLRAAVAEGITIVTHQSNKGLYEKVMANPHKLIPDKLEMTKPRPVAKVQYIGDKNVFTDGTHTIETYHLEGSTHNDGMLIVWLPQQKILFNGDEFNVNNVEPTAPVDNPNGYQVNLLAQIERLKLDVQRHIPVHLPAGNRKVSAQELRFMAGRQ
jgi:glyoxylase-like metal-dependent hydrolase (beta-lactamase superfamily II)